MTFIQLIETTSTRRDEMDALAERWRSLTEGRRTARRSTATHDRDRPDTYILIVEFPSYEAAMANSALPETADFAERLAELCDSPPTFRNLDVERVDELSTDPGVNQSAITDRKEQAMSRKVADCRDFPSQTNCTLTISGEEDEVLTAATQHAVSVGCQS
ncbi:MAG: putative quinol monooxygenase [Streptosporangiaceae bacterium]